MIEVLDKRISLHITMTTPKYNNNFCKKIRLRNIENKKINHHIIKLQKITLVYIYHGA